VQRVSVLSSADQRGRQRGGKNRAQVLYKDCRLPIPREAEGTLGKYALMVKPMRASPFQPTSASAAAWRGFTTGLLHAPVLAAFQEMAAASSCRIADTPDPVVWLGRGLRASPQGLRNRAGDRMQRIITRPRVLEKSKKKFSVAIPIPTKSARHTSSDSISRRGCKRAGSPD
jgi:hypothetical protein